MGGATGGRPIFPFANAKIRKKIDINVKLTLNVKEIVKKMLYNTLKLTLKIFLTLSINILNKV